MKNKNNKKNNKKFRLGLFIKISVALMLLISMTISFSSGTAVAEFVKTFSANIDFEGIPSPPWSYYLYDANGTTTNGTYSTYKSFSQEIKTSSTVKAADLIYEIKLPVSGTGLYNIDFTVDFTGPKGWSGYVYSTGSGSLNLPVGCKINTKSDGFTKKVTTLTTATYTASKFDECGTTRSYNAQPVYGPDPYGIHTVGNSVPLNFNNFHDYQWKTLAPKNSEKVSLTFYIADASKAAIWSWDLRGLGDKNDNSGGIVNGTYTLSLTNISIKKIDDPATDEPYLDFADTHYVNNALHPNSSSSFGKGDTNLFQVKSGPDGTIKGKDEGGKTRTNVARGTYITEATYNSMTMQAEKLVFGYHNGNLVDSTYMDGKAGVDKNGKSLHERYSNLVSFGIPIKNVKAGKSYKITFDVGFARQGSDDVENQRNKNYDYTKYANHGNIFSSSDATLHMESYLYRGIISGTKIGDGAAAPKTDYGLSQGFSIPFFTDTYFGRGNFYDPKMALFNTGAAAFGNANKGQAKSRYNEMWDVNKGANYIPEMSTATSVNDLENISTNALFNTDSIGKYNWYNAIRHTETNGENVINWITFTNNTFTFTVDEDVQAFYENNLSQLRWIWALDGLEEKSWYRIKFDNVRIEEVVTYGSNIANDSLGFNSTSAGYRTYEDIGLFRGANGTGQNYKARGYEGSIPFANMNVYAPIYDAKGKTVIDSNNDQRISLSGYAVCNGGVEKYVWSADGGVTWYDMESQRVSDATAAVRLLAEEHAENSTIGLKGKQAIDDTTRVPWSGYICEYATFTAVDGVNGQFEITANLKGTPYAGKTGLNIIFAAVPFSNSSARLELIRITNYNS